MAYKVGIDTRLWNETGVGRYIRNLVLQLQKIDKENEYVLFVRSQDKDSIQNILVNSKWSFEIADIHWHSVEEQLKFGKLIEDKQLDLMHFPYFSVPVRFKGKFVLTIHDLILHQFPTGKASTKSQIVYWFKHMAYKYVISQAAKKAEKIITVSFATKEEIIKQLKVPSSKIFVTYEGVDEKIVDEKESLKDLPSKYFLYVGNAYPHKNLERLVSSFNLLTQSMSDIKLILVGKEDFFYKRLKRNVKKLNLVDKVLFMTSVSDAKLAALYENALALVLPSLMEGFGLPVIEAMAQNCLVAVSDIPVFHEIAKDAAIYFNPQDVQSIKNVLESIAKGDVPDETKKKEKGKQLAATFSWKKMAEETQKIYQSCLGV